MVDGTLTVSPPKSTISSELALRIHGGNHDGQIVRLRSRKCTIGSGPRCTLRLRARGILPLHCLVVRGSAAVIVRRWAPDTLLNGHDFRDAELTVGDILGMGPLQIEVIAPASGGEAQRQTSLPDPSKQAFETSEPDGTSGTDETSDTEAQLAEAREELQQQRRRWQQEKVEEKEELDRQTAELQQRVAELEAQAAELDNWQDDLNRRKQQWETQQGKSRCQLDARSEELQSQLAELDSLRHELKAQQDQWRQEQADSQTRFDQKDAELEVHAKNLDARASGLEEHFAELDARAEDLRQQRQQLEAEQAENQRSRETESENIQSQLAQLETRQKDFQKRHDQWEQEKIQSQQQFDSRTQQLNSTQEELRQQRQQRADERTISEKLLSERLERIEAREADLDARAEQLRKQCVELDTQREAAEKVSQTEPSPAEIEFDQTQADCQPDDKSPQDSPVDLAEVLNHVGSANLVPSDRSDEQEPQAQPQPVGSVEESTVEPAAEENTNEEESIDDYMTRLIQRVSGTDEEFEHPQEQQLETQLLEQEDERIEPPRPRPRLIEPADMEPRAKAPEKHIDLTAMRQLANVSANAAIDKHAHRQMVGTKRSKLLVSVVALIGGGMLLWMWWNLGVATLAYYAALVSFMVALLWGIEYAIITGRMIVNRSGSLDWRSLEESAEPTDDEQTDSRDGPPVDSLGGSPSG